jgi:hypothetical protein
MGLGDQTDSLHCALGEAAWTDLFSNQTQLSGFDPPKDLYPLFSECKIPDKCVSSFLHEATHNICFQSPVGYAASYLHSKTLLDMIGTTDPKTIVRSNWLKTRALNAVMRPISEGLALLCEFDVFPRQSDDVWSHPMWWLYYFTKPLNEQEVKSSTTLGDALYLRLMNLRGSKGFIRHKRCLLLHPMDTSEGGYLSGYMTVRRLWYWAAIKCEKFNNIDFFLRYLSTYFFSDPRLVWALLSPASSVSNSVDRILIAFQLRLREFFDLDFEEEAKKLTAGQKTFSLNLDLNLALGKPNGCWPLAVQALTDLTDSVSVPEPNCDAEYLLRLTGLHMAQRELFCLANVPVEIRKKDENSFEVYFEANKFAQWTYRQGMEGRAGGASVACYVSLLHKRIVHCVTQGTELVSIKVFQLVASNVPTSQIERYFLDFRVLKELNDGLLTIYKAYVKQSSPDDAVECLEKHLQNGVSEVYARHALQEVKEARFNAVYQKMCPTGFLGALGSSDLVEALAALTLGASMRGNVADVVEMFKVIQPDLEKRLKKLELKAEGLDFTLYEQQSSRILSFV